MKKGFEPYLPVIRNGPVDLLVDKGPEGIKRVQVKTGTWVTSGTYRYLQARIRSANRMVTAQSGHYDLLFVVYEDMMWEIPAAKVFSSNICLRGTHPGRAEAWEEYRVA